MMNDKIYVAWRSLLRNRYHRYHHPNAWSGLIGISVVNFESYNYIKNISIKTNIIRIYINTYII